MAQLLFIFLSFGVRVFHSPDSLGRTRRNWLIETLRVRAVFHDSRSPPDSRAVTRIEPGLVLRNDEPRAFRAQGRQCITVFVSPVIGRIEEHDVGATMFQ